MLLKLTTGKTVEVKSGLYKMLEVRIKKCMYFDYMHFSDFFVIKYTKNRIY